jgi:hypothetical protein
MLAQLSLTQHFFAFAARLLLRCCLRRESSRPNY